MEFMRHDMRRQKIKIPNKHKKTQFKKRKKKKKGEKVL